MIYALLQSFSDEKMSVWVSVSTDFGLWKSHSKFEIIAILSNILLDSVDNTLPMKNLKHGLSIIHVDFQNKIFWCESVLWWKFGS